MHLGSASSCGKSFRWATENNRHFLERHGDRPFPPEYLGFVPEEREEEEEEEEEEEGSSIPKDKPGTCQPVAVKREQEPTPALLKQEGGDLLPEEEAEEVAEASKREVVWVKEEEEEDDCPPEEPAEQQWTGGAPLWALKESKMLRRRGDPAALKENQVERISQMQLDTDFGGIK